MLTNQDIAALVIKIRPEVGAEGIDAQAPLTSLGFDSLDFMNLFFELEEQYGVALDEEDIDSKRLDNIEKIVAACNASHN
jgi:Phosphopantetheine attachment site.